VESVRADAQQPEARIAISDGGLGVGRENPDRNLRLRAGPPDALDRRLHFGIGDAARLVQAGREVKGTDEGRVDAGDGEDGLDMAGGLDMFGLGDHGRFPIVPAQRTLNVEAIALGPGDADAPDAEGRVLGRGHGPGRVGRGVDVGDDEAGGARIEGLGDPDGIVVGDADDARAFPPNGLDDALEAEDVVEAVLPVEEQPVELGLGVDFREFGGWEGDQDAQERFLSGQSGLESRGHIFTCGLEIRRFSMYSGRMSTF